MKKVNLLLLFLFFVHYLNAQKYAGGDISLLDEYENHSALYYDTHGRAIVSPLEFFKQQGMNTMRVRLFVNPDNATVTEKGEGVCQNLNKVKMLGKRIKEAGLKLMLDFHYSDTWADPAKQFTPDAWSSLDDVALQYKIYEYTKEVLMEMKAFGADPDFIQTGNEISFGMCWGNRNESGDWKRFDARNTENAVRFTDLLKNAGKACREICPDAKVILHIERVTDALYSVKFYKLMEAMGVDYDIIGLSYYPYFHGGLDKLNQTLVALETNYPEKDIMIVETGYYHSWQPSSVIYNLSSIYPISDEGQKKFADALVETLRAHDKVKGLFWWWMEANECGLDWSTNRVTDNWYNAGLFDNQTGCAKGAFASFKRFMDEQQSGTDDATVDANKAESVYSLSGLRLTENQFGEFKGVFVVNGKKVVK